MTKGFCKIILLFQTVAIALSSIGQDRVADLPKITPPSPNAASLGKFGEVPVSLYTGIPDITIPLYTAKAGSFSLPVSLQYHSQGLKVEEIAGVAGLQWALNAGGVITRAVRTLPDEDGLGYWTHADWTNDYIASDLQIMMDVAKGVYDMEPDIFYFNFNGKSGKFMLDATSEHKAHIIPWDGLNITHDATLSQFQILDEDGIKYTFAAKEMTTDDNSPPTIRYFASAWYLTKIETPGGDITFTYSSESTYQMQLTEVDRLKTGPDPQNCNFGGYQGFTSYITIDALILTEINTPTEKISFQISGNRRDMPSCNKLDAVTVTDYNGLLKKKYLLSYSYFGNLNTTASEAVRLKLDAVTEVSVNNDGTKNYSFEYYDADQVPALSNKGRDYWGFYNGKANTTLLPYIDPIRYGAYAANEAPTYGDRDPVFEKARVGVLKKIKYPTGGTTELVYEQHDYGNVAGDDVEEYTKYSYRAVSQAKISGSINIPSQTTLFTINELQGVTVYLQGTYTNPPPVENGPTILLRKVNADGTKTNIIQRFMLNTTEFQYPYLQPGNYELIASVDGSAQFASVFLDYYQMGEPIIKSKPAGGIRIKKIISYDPESNTQNIKSYQYTTIRDPSKSSGHLVTQPVMIYSQGPVPSEGPGCSRLIRVSYSNNYLGVTQGSHIGYSNVTEIQEGSTTTNGKRQVSFTSTSDIPNTNYYTHEYAYSVNPGYLTEISKNAKYLTDYDFCRGLLTNETVYDANGNKVKETNNSYNYADAIVPTGINYFEYNSKIGYLIPRITVNGNGGGQTTFYAPRLVTVKGVIPWICKTSSVETIYSNNGAAISSTSNYFYDNPTHGQLTRIETTNSKGQAIKTVNKYAGDKNLISGIDANASTALDNMVLKNMIRPVIQSEHYNNNNLLSLSRTDYKVWDANAKIISPEKVWQQTLNNTLENRIVFSSYDAYNNILEMAKKGDLTHSYIWDYKNSVPVAEVLNAPVSNIAYTSFESDGTGNWTIGSNNRQPGGITGKSCYQAGDGAVTKTGLATGTTYTVSYWTTNTGPFTIAGTQGSVITGKKIGNWTYFEHKVSGVSQVSIPQVTGLIDELRLYPADAQMTTYTYEPLIGVTSQCAVNNAIVYYEYDGFLRLKLIRDQDGNIVKTFKYNYKQ